MPIGTKKWNGLLCSVCKEPQFDTPRSGPTCKNGHGGAEGVENVVTHRAMKNYGVEPDEVQEQPKTMRGPDALKQQAQTFVHRLSLPVPDAPLTAQGEPLNPQLPDDITALSMDRLGHLYGQFMAVASYAEPQVGLADIEHTEAKARLLYIEARSGLEAEGSNQQERKWQLQLDPDYQRALADERTAYAKFTLLQHLLRRYEKAAAALSRELTRRGVESVKDIT